MEGVFVWGASKSIDSFQACSMFSSTPLLWRHTHVLENGNGAKVKPRFGNLAKGELFTGLANPCKGHPGLHTTVLFCGRCVMSCF